MWQVRLSLWYYVGHNEWAFSILITWILFSLPLRELNTLTTDKKYSTNGFTFLFQHKLDMKQFENSESNNSYQKRLIARDSESHSMIRNLFYKAAIHIRKHLLRKFGVTKRFCKKNDVVSFFLGWCRHYIMVVKKVCRGYGKGLLGGHLKSCRN